MRYEPGPSDRLLWENSDQASLDRSFVQQQAFLEKLFDDSKLGSLRSQHPSHPAVVLYHKLTTLLSTSHWETPSSNESFEQVGRFALDTLAWLPHDEVDPWTQTLDDDARDKLRSRLRESEQFEDVMAELAAWGWLTQGCGFDVVFRSSDASVTDLLLTTEDGIAVPCDVKRIHIGTRASALRKRLEEANRQIKVDDDNGVGVSIVSLASLFYVDPTVPDLPSDVEAVAEVVRRRIGGTQLKSVSAVVLQWDTLSRFENDEGEIGLLLRRRSHVIEHAHPRRLCPAPVDQLASGLTIVMLAGTRTDARAQGRDGVIEALRYVEIDGRHCSTSVVVGADHSFAEAPSAAYIEAAFSDLETVRVYGTPEPFMSLATHVVTGGRRDYVVVAVAWGMGGDWIATGYRLRCTDDQLAEFSDNPDAAFAELLVRYGFRYTMHGRFYWWYPVIVARPPMQMVVSGQTFAQVSNAVQGVLLRRVGFDPRGSVWRVQSHMKAAPNYSIHVLGFHIVNLDLYRADAQTLR